MFFFSFPFDQQVVNFQFEDGATANFTMVAFTKNMCTREVKVYGTMGEISYEDGWDKMHLCDFRTGKTGNSCFHSHVKRLRRQHKIKIKAYKSVAFE